MKCMTLNRRAELMCSSAVAALYERRRFGGHRAPLQLSCFAGCGIPAFRIGFLLVMRADDHRLSQILRILDDGLQNQPVHAIRSGNFVKELRHLCVPAVRRTILAKVSRTHVCRHNLEVSSAASRRDPLGHRLALQSRLSDRRRFAKAEETSLCSSIRVDAQRIVTFPGDMQASWNAHEEGRAIGFASIAGRLVLRRIPEVTHATSFGIQGKTCKVPFFWSDHSPLPVFGDIRDPVPGHIHSRGRSGSLGRRRRAASLALGPDWSRQTKKNERRKSGWNSVSHFTLLYTASTNMSVV